MRLSSILGMILLGCMTALITIEGKSKPFKISKKKMGTGKYDKKCEKEDMEAVILDENDMDKVVKAMLKANIHQAWIGGIKGVNYDGSFLLNIEVKQKGKYESHYFTLVPASKAKKFTDLHFALCRKPIDEDD